MSGTIAGGKKAAITNKLKYGQSFYKVQGAIGGSVKNPTKGFGGNRELARIAGKAGGLKSRRGTKKYPPKNENIKVNKDGTISPRNTHKFFSFFTRRYK